MRLNEEGQPEIWTNLGDLLDWLERLPNETNYRVAGDVALEIRQMLLAALGHAELIQKKS